MNHFIDGKSFDRMSKHEKIEALRETINRQQDYIDNILDYLGLERNFGTVPFFKKKSKNRKK